ncbi:MAG: 50S ribosomal protein L9 [Elusimicrobia bacterium]|nr:50S ribosomal protein L9 [Elusimicrobiota bacterium]
MKIIIDKDTSGLGKAGDVKNVADGFARNYLLPKRLAVVYSEGAARSFELKKAAGAKKFAKEAKEALALKSKIEKIEMSFPVLVDEKGELYGSVGKGQILKMLRNKGIAFNRAIQLTLDAPLKAVGVFTVPLKLHPDVTADLRVTVVRSEPAAQ